MDELREDINRSVEAYFGGMIQVLEKYPEEALRVQTYKEIERHVKDIVAYWMEFHETMEVA